MRHSKGESETDVDTTSMSHVHIELPDGVTHEEVHIVGAYCDARGQRDEGMDVVEIKSPTQPPEPEKDPIAPTTSEKSSETAATVMVDTAPEPEPAADTVVTVGDTAVTVADASIPVADASAALAEVASTPAPDAPPADALPDAVAAIPDAPAAVPARASRAKKP